MIIPDGCFRSALAVLLMLMLLSSVDLSLALSPSLCLTHSNSTRICQWETIARLVGQAISPATPYNEGILIAPSIMGNFGNTK